MTEFDERKAYAKQEDIYFNDGREIEVLHFVYNKTNIDEIRGSPEKVLAAIDEYGRKHKYLMNVGEDKGKIVCDVIAETKPETMVQSLLRVTTIEDNVNCRPRWSLAGTLVTPPYYSQMPCEQLAEKNTTASKTVQNSPL